MAYSVRSGDTLWALARQWGISLSELERLNPQISNPDLIRVGQSINTPGQAGGAVQAGGAPQDPNEIPIGVPNPDIGGALQQYAADPTQDQALLQDIQAMNLPFSQQTTQFLQDELAMQQANGWGDHLTAFRLPAGVSSEDFLQIAGFAHDWAALNGFKRLPNWGELNWIASHGITDRLEAYRSFAQWANNHDPGFMDSHPWAAAGLSKSQYDDQMGSLQDTVEELTGSRDTDLSAFGLSSDSAVQNRWSSARWRQELVGKLGADKKYGYLRHGMNYQQWTQYQTENAPAIRGRFGSVTAENALTMLDQPLERVQSAGATVSTSQQAQARQTIGATEIR